MKFQCTVFHSYMAFSFASDRQIVLHTVAIHPEQQDKMASSYAYTRLPTALHEAEELHSLQLDILYRRIHRCFFFFFFFLLFFYSFEIARVDYDFGLYIFIYI